MPDEEQVEVEFFLSHWHEIRASETMKNVWLQIRNGRHPGFEEGSLEDSFPLVKIANPLTPVWPLIAQSLEFNPSTSGAPTSPKVTDS